MKNCSLFLASRGNIKSGIWDCSTARLYFTLNFHCETCNQRDVWQYIYANEPVVEMCCKLTCQVHIVNYHFGLTCAAFETWQLLHQLSKQSMQFLKYTYMLETSLTNCLGGAMITTKTKLSYFSITSSAWQELFAACCTPEIHKSHAPNLLKAPHQQVMTLDNIWYFAHLKCFTHSENINTI